MLAFGILMYLASATAFYAFAVKTALPSQEATPTLLLLVNNEADEQARRAA